MLFVLVGLPLVAQPARAAEPESSPASAGVPAPPVEPGPELEPAGPTPAERLAEARRVYSAGRPAEARAQLQTLLTLGAELPAEVRVDTYAWLGELLYNEQGASAAAPYFRALLDEDPDYVMDPLEHPDDVSRYFESLRPRPTPLDSGDGKPPARKPPPWLALAPGGVFYFAKGEIGVGVAVAGTQAALLVTNLVLYTQISGIEGVERGTPAVAEWRGLRLATDLTAGAFYLSLVLPPAIELGRWGVENPKVAVGVGPGAVTVRGTF